jgi:hypothetical protein
MTVCDGEEAAQLGEVGDDPGGCGFWSSNIRTAL